MNKLSEITIKVILYVAILLGAVTAVVVFIPTFIWGLCNGFSVKEIFYTYWIEGFGEEIMRNLDLMEEI